jgi:hypothetical protein
VRPDVYVRDRRTIDGEGLIVVAGAVQQRDGVLNLMARQVLPLDAARRPALQVPRAEAILVARSHDYV